MSIINLEAVHVDALDASAVKCFFKCNEATGATAIVDYITGATTAALDVAVTNNANGSIDFMSIIKALSPAIPAPGAGADFVFTAFVHILGGAIQTLQLGASAAHYIAISSTGCTVKGATGTTVSLGAYTSTSLRKIAIVGISGGNTTLYQAAVGASLLAGAGTPVLYSTHGNLTTAFAELTAQGAISNTAVRLYGMKLMSFTGGSLPTDYITMADWEMEQWYLNNKDIYPRLTEI